VKSVTAKPRSPALAAVVKSFHYHECGLPFALERIVPNGQAHLMVNLAEDEFRTYHGDQAETVHRLSGAVLAGPHRQPTVLDTQEQCWLAAVEFRGGGAGSFFSFPMTEVSDQVVCLEDVWGLDGRRLRERLLEAATPESKLHVLEEILLEHFTPRSDPSLLAALDALQHGMSVARVADHLGLSSRTLTRRVSAQAGLTPKRYARVQRLQRVLCAVRHSPAADWCSLAADHGYADQAHLIHEFRDLAGITPAAYRPHSPQRSNHIPIRLARSAAR
jgi:AraC-like DNA-binding protein